MTTRGLPASLVRLEAHFPDAMVAFYERISVLNPASPDAISERILPVVGQSVREQELRNVRAINLTALMVGRPGCAIVIARYDLAGIGDYHVVYPYAKPIIGNKVTTKLTIPLNTVVGGEGQFLPEAFTNTIRLLYAANGVDANEVHPIVNTLSGFLRELRSLPSSSPIRR